jgi:hypothetical protein
MKKPYVIIWGPGGKKHRARPPTNRQIETSLRPYALELGYLAIAWNELHDQLSHLFGSILKAQGDLAAKAIWHATENDFVQRKMLRALILADGRSSLQPKVLSAKQAEDILWILNQIDEKLRHKRNNAIHAPMNVVQGVVDGKLTFWVEARFDPINPRSRPLRGKELISEFQDYTADADMLASYAYRIWMALRLPTGIGGPTPWPDRPPSPRPHKMKSKIRRAPRRLPLHLR